MSIVRLSVRLPNMTEPNRARTFAEVVKALETIDGRQLSRTVDLLARMLDRTDQRLASASGISRPTINQKRTGGSPIRSTDLAPLAEALEVEVDVLLLPPTEAARWLVEHRPDLLNGAAALEHKGCTVVVFPAGSASTRRAIMPVPVGAGASTGVSAVAA